jgi:hypothetical protein
MKVLCPSFNKLLPATISGELSLANANTKSPCLCGSFRVLALDTSDTPSKYKRKLLGSSHVSRVKAKANYTDFATLCPCICNAWVVESFLWSLGTISGSMQRQLDFTGPAPHDIWLFHKVDFLCLSARIAKLAPF